MKLRCRLGSHLWVVDQKAGLRRCLYCGTSRRSWPTLRCRLGIHKWVPGVGDDGERHLGCMRCGKYGGEPHGLVPWPGDRG